MSDTPTSTQAEVLSPRRTLVSSTPVPDKPDVSQLFQKLGDKLGWFQYNNLDTAIETLSKSAKKKSTRSRRDKTKQTDDTHTLQDADCKPRRKHQKEKNQQKYDKEDECKENRKPKEKRVKSHTSYRTDRSHSSREVDEVFEADEEQGVPVRKSTACTDLTRSQTNHRKKHRQKPKTIVSNSESPSVPHDIRLSNALSSSESPEYFGDCVTESTRIHSDASLDCVLDSADVSAISFHRPDSVSGGTAMDSFRYNSNDDSYKLLNIKCDRSQQNASNSPQTLPTNVNLQALTLNDSNHDDSKGDNSLKTVSHSHLYTTAPCILDDSVEVIESSCNSEKDTTSSGSSYEVEDVSVQVQTHSEEDTGNHKLSTSSTGSSYEVEDVSVQVDPAEQFDSIKSISPNSKNQHQCLKSDSSEKDEEESYIEVEDTSMQTSIQFSPESQTTPDVDVESESVVTGDHLPEKQEDSILENLHNISLPDLDFDMQPKSTFPKRDPSIYFDAIDAAKLVTKFRRRDPSVYFDAKQSLLSDSHSSSTGQTPSPTKDPSGPGAKGDNCVKSDIETPSGVISLSDSDSDIKQVEKSPEIFQKKHCQYNSFSSDSENDFKSKYFSKNKSKVKSQRKYSSSTDSSDSDIKSKKRSGHVPRSTVVAKNGLQYHKDKSGSSPPDSDKVSGQLSNQHWRTKQTIEADSSSEDEALETFFQKMRGSKKKLSSEEEEEEENNDSMKGFVVDDSDVSEDEDDAFYISTAYKTSFVTKEDQKKILPIVFRDSSSEEEDFKTPRITSKRNDDQVFKTPLSTKKKPRKLHTPSTDIWGLKEDNCLYPPGTKYSFLKSLTENLPPHKCDPEAIRFIKTFKKSKQELTQRLFKIYNETVFENKLPDDLDVIWNCRLLRTAGYCVYKKVSTSGGARNVRIELSTKVCDSAERVRDTLIHEMCHAAVWLVNGKTDGHGPYWRYWAKKSNQTHPEIPVIGRCHSYSINTKFTYQCSQCGYRIGRHSKSLNTDIKVCGYCHGRFVLLSNTGQNGSTPGSGASTPRTPNKFALFVKDNYGDVKKREHNLKHKDIMKILSQEFAKSKISG